MLRVISLGAGVQSTTLALMAAKGEIGPMPDCAIFADTQGEPRAVYDHLTNLERLLPFPVYRVSAGSLWESATTVRTRRDGKETYIATGIPVYLRGVALGIGMRQCTRDFKIAPIEKKLRELLGRSRIRHDEKLVEMWIGISQDEAHRMKESRLGFVKTRWPLIEIGMSRHGCLQWMKCNEYPAPPKSACTFCPYHNDRAWLALEPDEFADACAKEKELQAAYASASQMRGVPYLHASRQPLGEVDFSVDDRQPDLFGNECEGMCGV